MDKPFPWRAGMRFVRDGDGYRIITISQYEVRFWAWAAWDDSPPITQPVAILTALDSDEPDPTDGATRGAFLDAVRKAWGEPLIDIRWSPTWKQWYPYRGGDPLGTGIEGDERRFTLGGYDSEWDAMVAAWKAAP